MRKILCLDYDVTLLDHKTNQIPSSALEYIDKVRNKYRIVLASGRFFNDSSNQHIKQIIKPDAIIHANGAVVEVNSKILYETFIDCHTLQSLVNYAASRNICIGSLYDGNWYSTVPVKESWIEKGNIPLKNIKNAKELFGKKIHSLFLFNTAETAALIEKKYPELRAYVHLHNLSSL